MEVRAEYEQFQIHISQSPRTCSLLARVYYDVTWYAFDSMLFTSRCIGATMFIGIIRFYLRNLYHTSRSCVRGENHAFRTRMHDDNNFLEHLLYIDFDCHAFFTAYWSVINKMYDPHMNLSNVCNIKSIWDLYYIYILYIYWLNIFFYLNIYFYKKKN